MNDSFNSVIVSNLDPLNHCWFWNESLISSKIYNWFVAPVALKFQNKYCFESLLCQKYIWGMSSGRSSIIAIELKLIEGLLNSCQTLLQSFGDKLYNSILILGNDRHSWGWNQGLFANQKLKVSVIDWFGS